MASSAMTAPASPVVEMQMQPVSHGIMGMIEAASKDPNFDAAKFKTLVDMRNDELQRIALEAFNAAMHACQSEMRPIGADKDNKQTSSRYATYAKLDKALRPIYSKHGFSVSYNTIDSPLSEHMRVLGFVSHSGGYTRTYQIDIPTDGKGAKGNDVMTKTHAVGAGASYGMRYLLKMIFNVLVGEEDRDGNQVESEVRDPDGFEAWVAALNNAANKGTNALQVEWQKTTVDFRKHMAKHYAAGHEARKVRARNVAQS